MAEARAVTALPSGMVHHKFQLRWLLRPGDNEPFLAGRSKPAYKLEGAADDSSGSSLAFSATRRCWQRETVWMVACPKIKKLYLDRFRAANCRSCASIRYFADLEPEAFDQLCRYAKHSTLKRGATIFSKGDPGNSLFAVISGTVKISISSPDGRNAILNLIGPGEIFGEVALLDGQARTADATANTNCELFVIDRREFIPFVRSQPALAMKFIELLCSGCDGPATRSNRSSFRICRDGWPARCFV